LKKICKKADEMGVSYVTVYAFSTENWKRPKAEVDFLMNLLRQYLKDSIKKAKKDNMRIRVIGDRTILDEDIRTSIAQLEEASKDATGLKLQIALNYGGRDELLRCMRIIAEEVTNGTLAPESIDENCVANKLDTAGIPDPDLMIRTSGEMRLSNFLPWQLAYSEFYFSEKHWPDFKEEDFEEALKFYAGRKRRFGGVEA
jgi:undecaprenyl diphosphate synthase